MADIVGVSEVYKNIIEMLKLRKVVLDSAPLSSAEVVQKINHYEFIMIAGNRKDDVNLADARVYCYLIAPGSKYANKSPNFVTMMRQSTPKPGENVEVIIISDVVLTKHISKQIKDLRQANYMIEDHDYEKFTTNVPQHEGVPKHEIVPMAEAREWARQHHTSIDSFQKILQTDSCAVWHGIKPGMFVKITRVSETAGTAIAYRYCIKG